MKQHNKTKRMMNGIVMPDSINKTFTGNIITDENRTQFALGTRKNDTEFAQFKRTMGKLHYELKVAEAERKKRSKESSNE